MKNKYQEALNFITDCIELNYKTIKDLEAIEFYCDMVQELVDKEIPMKLVGDMYHRRCRLCGNQNLNTKWTYGNYCSGCGQKIDWGNEE